ncbi:polysaccharide biosynthesis/export family protein [Horticoccus sp. 23ND18S-11]|uniref:polysaccharide biosynthesis/export family protein n=1 Tax=Horticoccus sp. 23ND18S-11 TaxID=3391832 RepID=UPI0039C98E12
MRSRLSPLVLASLLALGGLVPDTGFAADKAAKAPAESPRESVPGDYVLQPMDVLRVQVFQEDDINKQGEVSISQEHTVFLPLIKTISLKGKTVRQAETMIRELYDRDFLVNPQVSVIVLKYAERSVNVIGAVNNAGRVQFPQEGRLNILDAISLAGGQNRLSDLKRVKLTRHTPNGDVSTQEIDVDALMKRGGRDAVPLEKGDVIFVPERIL